MVIFMATTLKGIYPVARIVFDDEMHDMVLTMGVIDVVVPQPQQKSSCPARLLLLRLNLRLSPG